MRRFHGFQAAALCAGIVLIAAGAAAGDGVSLERGAWRIEQVTRTPLQPQPQVQTFETCVGAADFTPDHLVSESHGACEITDVQVQGETMTWSIDCPEAQSSGTGEFTADGPTAAGQMQMRMQFQGQEMPFTVDWAAEHVGSCS